MAAAALRHVRRNLVAYLALFVALGGTSYAAIKLPANSVGTRQLKRGAVTAAKIKPHSLLLRNFKAGQIPAGSQGPIGPQGPAGKDGVDGKPGQNGQPGQDGQPGADGKTVLNGVGAPPDDVGSPGDFYIDVASHKMYGPKSSSASGAWGSGVDLVGASDVATLSGRVVNVPLVAGSITTYYGAPSGFSTASLTAGDMQTLSPHVDMVATNLSVQFTQPPGPGGAFHDVVLMVNGTPSSLQCSASDDGTSCASSSGALIPADSRIEIAVLQGPFGGTAAATDVLFGLQTVPAS